MVIQLLAEVSVSYKQFYEAFFGVYILQLLWCTFVLMPYSSPLRHCATGRKVAGSLPDGVTGIFH